MSYETRAPRFYALTREEYGERIRKLMAAQARRQQAIAAPIEDQPLPNDYVPLLNLDYQIARPQQLGQVGAAAAKWTVQGGFHNIARRANPDRFAAVTLECFRDYPLWLGTVLDERMSARLDGARFWRRAA